MSFSSSRFYAKLLLFGEYTIVKGSRALAMPYPRYGGELSIQPKQTDFVRTSQEVLREINHYLHQQKEQLPLLDLKALQEDLERGLWFDSNIPQGFGLGSSGALCAALYDQYGLEKTENIEVLKSHFAQLEGFFHGASSGIDPLICYLNQAILLKGKQQAEPVTLPPWQDTPLHIFLINTQLPRKTAPLVQRFLQWCEDSDFKTMLDNQLSPCMEACMDAFLKNEETALMQHLYRLSDLQYTYFRPMIPSRVGEWWKKGLQSKAYTLKLCGGGGGGFMLGFSTLRQAEIQTHFPSGILEWV